MTVCSGAALSARGRSAQDLSAQPRAAVVHEFKRERLETVSRGQPAVGLDKLEVDIGLFRH